MQNKMQSTTTIEEQSFNNDDKSIKNEEKRNLSTCSSPLASPKIPIDSQSSSTSYRYSLFPSTIPGILHAQNSGALDWSSNGLLAYGCQNLVVIVDSRPELSFRQSNLNSYTCC